jgi:hypothetical protein
VLRDLCLLMGDRLAAPPPPADRQRRLGLLVSLRGWPALPGWRLSPHWRSPTEASDYELLRRNGLSDAVFSTRREAVQVLAFLLHETGVPAGPRGHRRSAGVVAGA